EITICLVVEGNLALLEHLSARSDRSNDDGIDTNRYRQHRDPVPPYLHHVGGSARRTEFGRPTLRNQAAGLQILDQSPDGAAVELQRLRQLRPGCRPVTVDVSEQSSQVVTPDRVLGSATYGNP